MSSTNGRAPAPGTSPGARPMDLAWAKDIRDQCAAAGVPLFVKQVTVAYEERSDREDDDPSGGSAVVATSEYASFDELEAAVIDRYSSLGWRSLLDTADRFWHPALRQAWAQTQIVRDFDAASVHDRDLAVATGFFSGEAVASLGRAADGWEPFYLDLMADRLTDLGFTVTDRLPPAPGDESNPFSDPVLGTLQVRRYGHEALGCVRVDDLGEVFVRLVSGDNDKPVVTPVPDEDDDPSATGPCR